jgi:hypothetical protein
MGATRKPFRVRAALRLLHWARRLDWDSTHAGLIRIDERNTLGVGDGTEMSLESFGRLLDQYRPGGILAPRGEPAGLDPIAALEAESASLRDRLANCRLDAAAAIVSAEHDAEQRAADTIRHAAAEALRETAYELAQRLETNRRARSEEWLAGYQAAAAVVRARTAIEDTATPPRWRPPRPRQHH